MKNKALALLAASLFAAPYGSLTAADARSELAAELAPGPYVVSIDLQQLIALGKTAKPTSIWWDPEVRKNRDYITEQIRRAMEMERDIPPFLQTLEHGIAGIVVGYDSIPESRNPQFAAVLNFGDAAPDWRNWMHAELPRTDETGAVTNAGSLREYEGYYERTNGDERQATGAFIGFKENLMLGGMANILKEQPSEAVDASAFQHPVTLHVDLSKIIERVKTITEAGSWDRYGYKQWGKFIKEDLKPVADITVGIEENKWVGTIEMSGIQAHQGQAVGDAILKTIPTGAMAWLVTNMDLKTMTRQLEPQVPPQVAEMIKMQLGVDWKEALGWFTGDISIAVKPSVLIPEITSSIAITNKAALLQLIEQFLAPQGQAIEVPGADKAWQFNIPNVPVPVYVAINDAVIMASSNMMSMSAVLQGQQLHDASSAAGKAMYLDVNVPFIAQTYLPMVYGMTANISEPMQRSPLDRARWAISDCYAKMIQEGQVDAIAFSQQFDNKWTERSISALFPKARDVAQTCLDTFSVWSEPGNGNNQRETIKIFFKTSDGLMVFSGWNRQREISMEEASQITAGLKQQSGPSLANLPILHVEKPPMFDRHWFPPLHKVIEHMPTYTLSAKSAGPGKVVLREEGLPYMSVFMGAMATGFWFETAEREARTMHRKQEEARRDDAVEAVPAVEEVKENDF